LKVTLMALELKEKHKWTDASLKKTYHSGMNVFPR
jgi:hypothetical protein